MILIEKIVLKTEKVYSMVVYNDKQTLVGIFDLVKLSN